MARPNNNAAKARRKDIQRGIPSACDTMARARSAVERVLSRHDGILLTARDFQLFGELMTRKVEPNDLVRSEAEAFNRGYFDAQGRYHW